MKRGLLIGAVGGLGIGKTLDSLKQSLGGVVEDLGGGITDATEDIGKSISEGAEEAEEKLMGLFGN